MKSLFSFIMIFLSIAASAQVTKVSLQASGLTCSMCSNSINKALKTLSFVENVNPNIQTSTFEITFKDGNNVDFYALKKKVEDAGFSVANFIISFNFKNVAVKPNEIIAADGQKFLFLNVKERLLTGIKELKIIDRGFVSAKEYKKIYPAIAAPQKGIYNVTIS